MQTDIFGKRALDLDQDDPLAEFRNLFAITDETVIYLDGNSLGRMPRRSADLLDSLIKLQWRERLIRSWNENWIDMPGRIATKIAGLIGAEEDEICIGDTTSVNLYKLAFGALAARQRRSTLVTDSLNFPSDRYVFEGLIRNHFPNHALKIVESEDEISVPTASIADSLDDTTALLSLSHVTYKSGFMYNMKAITALAHQHGVLTLWDLSHAAGAVPVNLNASNADLAVGCTYKHLNGGPGSPAFLYVRKNLQEEIVNPIWGWFSHKNPFDFDPLYTPQVTAEKYSTGTPGILSLAAVEPGVEILLEAGMAAVREKSLKQSRFLLEMFDVLLRDAGFSLGSPTDALQRGSHLSLKHPEGYRINRAMIDPDDSSVRIIPDFRPPDNIRLGITPLYTTFLDIYTAVSRIRQIVDQESYRNYPNWQGEVP